MQQPLEKLQVRLRDGWNEYSRWREEFLKAASPRAVHHLRTSIRKLSSRADLVAVHPEDAQPLLKLLDRERKCLGTARDSHAQAKLVRYRAPAPLKRRLYRRHLKKQEKRGIEKAAEAIGGWKLEKRRRALRGIEEKFEAELRGGPAGPRKVLDLLVSHLQRDSVRFERVRKKLHAGDHKGFHLFRILVKDLAYKTEMAGDLLCLPPARLKKLTELRKKLGRLQDEVVLLKNSKDYLKGDADHPRPRLELRRKIAEQEKAILLSAAKASQFRWGGT